MPISHQILPSRSAYTSPGARPTIVGGQGPWLLARDGRRYFDAACGSGSLTFGHGDERMVEIIAEQTSRLTLFPGRAFGVEVVEAYAEQLVDFAPKGFNRALTLSSGSDAVEAALKAALQYHCAAGDRQRIKIIGREASYHGNSLAGLAAGGFVSRRMPYEHALPQWSKAAAADCARFPCDPTSGACELECAQSVERAILQEGPETVAAVIIEPVVGAALSAVAPDPRYVARVRGICDTYGVLLIADEVMTGFGRTGLPFASSGWEVLPDLIIAGKAISAGYYPLSAVLVRENVAERLTGQGGYFENGQTNCCSPLGASIGIEVIRRLADGDLLARADRVGAILRHEIHRRVAGEVVRNVRGVGMMIGFDIELPPALCAATTNTPGELLHRAALDRALVIYPSRGGAGRLSGDHAMLLPPLTTSDAEVHHIVAALADAVGHLLESAGN